METFVVSSWLWLAISVWLAILRQEFIPANQELEAEA